MVNKEFKPEKEFKAGYLKDIKDIEFKPSPISGINDITINQDISIET